ncbi:hypothetical protein [Novosphingobium panipatense]|uniref:Uncharacterized protein n=1 Tax=Novosphingobium panipatense TaxID=428991 RepID=A0ABY1Q7E9_9SPHN|nr:hypothetical protein [Novosphingobium panipatense]SMP61360.1 hypothetical protein SAMN06296065_103246 [Novosphingobium panipatense]
MIGLLLVALLSAQSHDLPPAGQAHVSQASVKAEGAPAKPSERARVDPASAAQMQAFGRCVAQRQPARAAALLQMDFNTPQFNGALKKLALSEAGCLGLSSKARFAGVLFAGALAEQLLAGTEDLAAALAYDPAGVPVRTFSLSDYIAACVARTAPDGVAGLLETPPASGAEETAMSQLLPVVQQCVPKDQQAQFNRAGLRAILATASYRMVEAARNTGGRG